MIYLEAKSILLIRQTGDISANIDLLYFLDGTTLSPQGVDVQDVNGPNNA